MFTVEDAEMFMMQYDRHIEISHIQELSTGVVNKLFLVHLASDEKLILRAYHLSEGKLAADKELAVCTLLRHKQIPAPEIFFVGTYLRRPEWTCSVMTKMEGQTLNAMRQNASKSDWASILEKSGEYLARNCTYGVRA